MILNKKLNAAGIVLKVNVSISKMPQGFISWTYLKHLFNSIFMHYIITVVIIYTNCIYTHTHVHTHRHTNWSCRLGWHIALLCVWLHRVDPAPSPPPKASPAGQLLSHAQPGIHPGQPPPAHAAHRSGSGCQQPGEWSVFNSNLLNAMTDFFFFFIQVVN